MTPAEKEKTMRQKYMLSRDDTKNQLKIREYAVTERDPKKVMVSMLEKSKFSFLCEETYASEGILLAIAGGMHALITKLRTRNIFPIAPYITPIAEAVITLYKAPEEGTIELRFDDADLVAHPEADAAT
jgi:hypothetical protein